MDIFLKFFNMGGYGVYVWSAYGLVAGALTLQLLLPWRRWRKLKALKKSPLKTNAHAQAQ